MYIILTTCCRQKHWPHTKNAKFLMNISKYLSKYCPKKKSNNFKPLKFFSFYKSLFVTFFIEGKSVFYITLLHLNTRKTEISFTKCNGKASVEANVSRRFEIPQYFTRRSERWNQSGHTKLMENWRLPTCTLYFLLWSQVSYCWK